MAIKSRNKPNAEFSTASISDIVFLLLIYFMLTASFVKQNSLKVNLPQGSSESSKGGKNYVTITEDGSIAWNNTVLEDREDLREHIEPILTDGDLENNVITLRLDRKVLVEDAVFVMDLASQFEEPGTVFFLTEKN